MSRFRHKMSRGRSRRVFRRSSGRTHKFNVSPSPMRGGIRL